MNQLTFSDISVGLIIGAKHTNALHSSGLQPLHKVGGFNFLKIDGNRRA